MQHTALTPVVAEQEPSYNDQTEAVELEMEVRVMLELEPADDSDKSQFSK